MLRRLSCSLSSVCTTSTPVRVQDHTYKPRKLFHTNEITTPSVASDISKFEGYILDMDGVIYRGKELIGGVLNFVEWLQKHNKKYLFLTNASDKTPDVLSLKLQGMGLKVSPKHFYTSALATAEFLRSQKPGGTAFVIGDSGLINALYDVGYNVVDFNPDYVVVGETPNFNYELLSKAINFVLQGARLIGTNSDVVDRAMGSGVVPSTGCLVAPIQVATGVQPYFVGKPSPYMMRHAIGRLKTEPAKTIVVGDRMDTDVISGIETGARTLLVLSGVTAMENLRKYAFRPSYILNGVADIPLPELPALPPPSPTKRAMAQALKRVPMPTPPT